MRWIRPPKPCEPPPEGAGLLILADGYPEKTTAIEPDLFDAAARKKLRLYVEYPSALPGADGGTAEGRQAAARRGDLGRFRRRATADADRDGQRLPLRAGRRQVPLRQPPRVGQGCRRRYGRLRPEGHARRAAAVRASPRKCPGGDHQAEPVRHRPVHARRSLADGLADHSPPASAGRGGFRRCNGRPPSGPATAATRRCRPTPTRPCGVRPTGSSRSRMLRHPQWPKEALDQSLKYNTVRKEPAAGWPQGDGSFGLLEGFSSAIRSDGSQPMRYGVRTDSRVRGGHADGLRRRGRPPAATRPDRR